MKSQIIVNNWGNRAELQDFFVYLQKLTFIVEMRLCNTIPERLLASIKRKQHNTLNTNDLGGGYCVANNPFNLFLYNLFKCHTRASDGFVVSWEQDSG